jgi:hypothetical protein
MCTALKCRWWGHQINRRRVKFDGLEFHTRCDRCGVALVRLPAGWIDDHPAAPTLGADQT